jgi:hypothetical protein
MKMVNPYIKYVIEDITPTSLTLGVYCEYLTVTVKNNFLLCSVINVYSVTSFATLDFYMK